MGRSVRYTKKHNVILSLFPATSNLTLNPVSCSCLIKSSHWFQSNLCSGDIQTWSLQKLFSEMELSSDQRRCRDPFELLSKFQRGINGGSSGTGCGEISGRHPLVTSSRTKSFSFAFNIFGLARTIRAFSIDISPPFD